MKTKLTANIYRFHDLVALSFDGTDTMYLTPAMAEALAGLLQKGANDVLRYAFTESKTQSLIVTALGGVNKE